LKQFVIASMLATFAMLAGATPASATAGMGSLFHDGAVVGTVVPPVAIPGAGTDPFYTVTNGTPGQLGIAGVAPGDGPYHGGAWEVFTVTFAPGVTPYLLTSDEAVFTARAAGDVAVARNAGADFRCPVTA
jgi:hypothetical protein